MFKSDIYSKMDLPYCPNLSFLDTSIFPSIIGRYTEKYLTESDLLGGVFRNNADLQMI